VAFAIFEPDGKANGEIMVVDMAFTQNINLNLRSYQQAALKHPEKAGFFLKNP
jgi:hypothetical protein